MRCAPPGPDRGAGSLAFVAAQVVRGDDVAFAERWGEDLLDIELENLAVDRAVDHRRRIDAIVTQGGDEGEGLPVAVGRVALQSPASWSPTRGNRHCLGSGLQRAKAPLLISAPGPDVFAPAGGRVRLPPPRLGIVAYYNHRECVMSGGKRKSLEDRNSIA